MGPLANNWISFIGGVEEEPQDSTMRAVVIEPIGNLDLLYRFVN